MPELANRMQRIKGSAIDAVAQKVRDLKEQGQEIINFSIGVPNFLPPDRIYEAAREDIDHDQGTYLPGRGTKELLQAFRLRMKEDGFQYREEEIVSGLGGKHVLFNIMLALLNTGDEVLIPTPYWTTYPDQVRLMGGGEVRSQRGRDHNEHLPACFAGYAGGCSGEDGVNLVLVFWDTLTFSKDPPDD